MAIDKASTYAWTAKGEQAILPLRLVRVTALASPSVKISRAFIRSSLDMAGTAQTTAQYRIQGPASRIALTLPAGSTEARFWFDRLPLKSERIREARPASGEYLLDIGALSPEPQPVLTVQYVDPDASPCGLIGFHRLSAPSFPDNTSIESTVWKVTFPFEQYLFSASPGFSPEFRWQRDGVVWDRRPTARAADLGPLAGAADPATDEGNSYAFSRFGPAQTIVVGSMAGSFVIFIGAGLSFLAAFILWRLRAARTLLSLFAFAFAVAVCCLWYGEAVRLLLQPALLGFGLAFGAAVVDARIQRRRRPLVAGAARCGGVRHGGDFRLVDRTQPRSPRPIPRRPPSIGSPARRALRARRPCPPRLAGAGHDARLASASSRVGHVVRSAGLRGSASWRQSAQASALALSLSVVDFARRRFGGLFS